MEQLPHAICELLAVLLRAPAVSYSRLLHRAKSSAITPRFAEISPKPAAFAEALEGNVLTIHSSLGKTIAIDFDAADTIMALKDKTRSKMFDGRRPGFDIVKPSKGQVPDRTKTLAECGVAAGEKLYVALRRCGNTVDEHDQFIN